MLREFTRIIIIIGYIIAYIVIFMILIGLGLR